MRAACVLLAVALLAGGCSGDKPVAATANQGTSEEILNKNCADAKWRDQNLGLWYSLCRQPLRW